MEIRTLYVLIVNGVAHYYAKEVDRNYHRNILTNFGTIPAITYEICLGRG